MYLDLSKRSIIWNGGNTANNEMYCRKGVMHRTFMRQGSRQWRTASYTGYIWTWIDNQTASLCARFGVRLHVTKSQILICFPHIDDTQTDDIYVWLEHSSHTCSREHHARTAVAFLFPSFPVHLQGSHVGMKLFICSGANLQAFQENTAENTVQYQMAIQTSFQRRHHTADNR